MIDQQIAYLLTSELRCPFSQVQLHIEMSGVAVARRLNRGHPSVFRDSLHAPVTLALREPVVQICKVALG